MKRIKQTLTVTLVFILTLQLCACYVDGAQNNYSSFDSSLKESKSVETASRSETDDDEMYVDFEIIGASSGCVINVSPDTAPFMAASFYAYDEDYDLIEKDVLDIEASIYQFDSLSDYKTALKNYYDNEYDGEGEKDDPSVGLSVDHVCDLNIKAETDDETSDYYTDLYYFDFPKALDEGWYVASFTINVDGEDFTVYRLIQSTPLSLNSFISSGQYIAWVNDETTGKPAKNAKISVSGAYKASGKTDDDGLLKTDLKDDDYNYYHTLFTAKYDGHVFCDAAEVTSISFYSEFKNRYYTYLISDRSIYMSDDEICFFGLIRNKSLTDNEKPKNVTVALYSDYDDDCEETEVTLNENGAFEGRISFENIKSGYYTLAIRADETPVYELTGIRITDYVKPVYTGSATSKKIAYMTEKEDERQANIDIELSYYDGTVANGFEMGRYYSTVDIDDESDTITIDTDGKASDSFDISQVTSKSWYPVYESIEYSGVDAEDENVYLSCGYYVFPYDVMIEGENDPETKTFTFNTYKITTDNLKSESDIWDYELLKDGIYETSVTAKLYKKWWEKVKTGEEYDKIYKTTYPVYDYKQHTDLVDTYKTETKDGKGSINYIFEDDDETLHASYYLECSYDDSYGNTVTVEFYICTRPFYNSYEQDNYMMLPKDTVSDTEDDSFYGTYNFGDGDDSAFYLAHDYEAYELKKNESLLALLVLTDGTITPYVLSDGSMDIPFDEKLCPNYTIYGMLFDGKYTKELLPTNMSFDYTDRELLVKISTQKDEYAPKEKAKVNVNVTYKDLNKSVPKGTQVVLSVVDEAVFDISEQEAATLAGLYARQSLPDVMSYTSFASKINQPYDLLESTAEAARAEDTAASGGSDNIRSDFKDTAYFAIGITDDEGSLSFDFTLPDNTTSWRLTALAITDDNFAGDTKGSLVVSLPYFVDPIINDTVLEGEDAVFGIRSAGRSVSSDDKCSYTVTVSGDDVNESVDTSADGIRDLAFAKFKNLKKGEYTVTITGTCGDYTDSVQYPFEVISSGLEIYTGVTSKVSDGIDIEPVRYPVDLWIYNKDAKTYNTLISDLLCSKDIRADERIGYYIAKKEVADKDTDGYFSYKIKDKDLSDLTVENGYLSLFKGNEGSRELTALSYIAAADIIDPYGTLSLYPKYAEEISDVSYKTSFDEDPSGILLKAAASHEADEKVIKKLLNGKIGFKESAYLTAALYLAGYKEKAEKEYASLVSEAYKTSKTVSGETGYYIEGDKYGTLMDNTAAALMLSSIINAKEMDNFAVYMSMNDSDDDIYPLQKAIYIINAKKRISEDEKVSYTLDGERHTEDINTSSELYLSLTKSELLNLELESEMGDPYMTIFYNGPVDEAGDEENKLIDVYTSFDKDSYKVGDKGIYTVNVDLSRLDTNAGNNTLIVDIYMPSGVRFNKYTPDSEALCSWYLAKREGQRLRFVILGSENLKNEKTASLDISFTCVTPGEYISESVYVSSDCSVIFGLSDRGNIVIEK